MIYDAQFESFKDYLDIELSDTIKEIVDDDINKIGLEAVIDKQLHYLDCTRWDSEHKYRIMQTIGVPYKKELAILIYVITTYDPENNTILDRLNEVHFRNLEYEKEFPPVVYKNSKNKTTKTKTDKPKKEKKEKTPKLTKEEKFKQKIQNLNFNIKI